LSQQGDPANGRPQLVPKAHGIDDRRAADGFTQKQWQYILNCGADIRSLGEWNSCNRTREAIERNRDPGTQNMPLLSAAQSSMRKKRNETKGNKKKKNDTR
jgi:hypothetical protein